MLFCFFQQLVCCFYKFGLAPAFGLDERVDFGVVLVAELGAEFAACRGLRVDDDEM